MPRKKKKPSKPKSKSTYKSLAPKGIPLVLIPGILFAMSFGPKNIEKIKNYYRSTTIFPKKARLAEVVVYQKRGPLKYQSRLLSQ